MDDLGTRPMAVMNRHDDATMAAAAALSLRRSQGPARAEAELRGGDIRMGDARMGDGRMAERAVDGRAGEAIPVPPRDDLVKVAFDRTAAVLGLVLLLPLLLMVAGLIWLRDPGPVLYAHPRVGRGGRVFRCLKFRTMVRNGDEVLARHLAADPEAAREWEETRKLRHDPRVTLLGRRLRKSSIDELPQLLNVVRGEMSLVGPRPIVEAEAHYYGAAMRDYTAVRPGLTGLWQVGGRSDTSYAERVRLDQSYVRNRSLWLDLKIILRTVVVVVKGRGSY